MSGANVEIKENNGNLFVGNQKFYNITCICGKDCHNHNAFQETSSTNAAERPVQHILPSLRVNNAHLAVLSDAQSHVTDTKLCVCAVYKQDDKIVVESSLSKIMTDFIRDKNCTHFEVQLKVKQICQICQGNQITTTYASQEFECTLISPQCDLGENIPLQLSRVPNCQPEPQTPFQTFLTQSQDLIKAEGNLIRIITEICENGKRVKIKLRFDARSSGVRRVKSWPDFETMRKELLPKKSNGFVKIRRNSFTKSSVSLGPGKRQSRITILDGEVDVQGSEKSEGLTAPDVQEECPENVDDLLVDLVDGLNLDELENQEPFATGKFGSLYKVTKDGRDQLVKIVKTNTENKKFLKEASQFCECRHPHIRPTANILEREERSLVFCWFLDGQSLFKALQENTITNYIIFCQILFGVVKGLVYLRRKGIHCLYLTPEKVLLDLNFNPRISGVGTAYFECSEYIETNDDTLHRSLSYLDYSLRSRHEQHPKNILWSVGRCIWDMLFGKICQEPEPENLLSKYIIKHLDEPCNDHKIKSAYFGRELRTIVFGAGWPNNIEITKSLVVCAFRCMLLNLEERMSLNELHKTLKTELCELQKKVKFEFYKPLPSDNLCLYCIENERDKLALTCGCIAACTDCLRNNVQLDCPEHGLHYSKIGHPLTYGVIIQGEFREHQSVCENDSAAMENLLNDQNIFAIKNIESVKSKSQTEACHELKRIKTKIMKDEKAKHSDIYPRTLLLYINGHCNKAGNLILPDGTTLKKKVLSEFISDTNPMNLIVLANGHYSEKLVKNLSELKTNLFYAPRKFFGVFSHAGNLCKMLDRDLSDENSILVRFVLDILKKDQSEAQFSSEEVTQRYLTVAGLADEISDRMQKKHTKCLMPVDRDGGHIPIVYI